MSATIRQVVSDAQQIVGEVTGPGVQMFSDDRMFGDAIRSFNMLFKKYNWRQYCTWLQLTLDGVTGTVTTNELAKVIDLEDIINVRKDGSQANLSRLPRDTNPFSKSLTSGSGPRYWDALNALNANYANKKIYIIPKTATGMINVFAKPYPVADEAWDWQDVMYLDRDMLAYGTAFMTLSSDDLNPGAADVAKNMMEMRYKDIQSQLASHEILFSPGNTGIPDQWQESGFSGV